MSKDKRLSEIWANETHSFTMRIRGGKLIRHLNPWDYWVTNIFENRELSWKLILNSEFQFLSELIDIKIYEEETIQSKFYLVEVFELSIPDVVFQIRVNLNQVNQCGFSI